MMKRSLFILIILACIGASNRAFAQTSSPRPQKHAAPGTTAPNPSSIAGGLGLTWIDGEPYYLVSLAPELAFGKFGAGLDINLRMSSKNQKLRPESGYALRMIRYLRYGNKGEDTYVRLGIIDNAKIGHGSIMDYYNNSPIYDERRIGSELDLSFGNFGFESVYSDFGRAGVVGVRGHVLPLKFTPMGALPVIGGIELGATWASDMRSNSRDIAVSIDTVYNPHKAIPQENGALSIVGFDIGLPLVQTGPISSTLYFDYAKIVNFGGGSALGIETNFNGLGILTIGTRFERRWQGDKYLPTYFDAFYEVDRYNLTDTVLKSKAKDLNSVVSPGPGYYGDILLDFMGFMQIRGWYSKYDRDPNGGILHLGTGLGDKIPMVTAEVAYDKKFIRNGKDVFTLDDRSILYADIGYKPYPFMIVSMLYTWTFKPERGAGGDVRYVPEKRITPKVSFVFPL